MSSGSNMAIAIIGIAAELPSGRWSESNLDYTSFCEFLLHGRQSYENIPTERFNTHVLTGNGSGQVITDTGSFIKNIDHFDPIEFGITSKDSRLMSLGTRRLIETSFLALLDSGINYRGRNIGCYMSAVSHDMFSISGHDDTEARGAFSYGPAMVANRVSYHLDLRGPSVPVDTACSSSLYATHLAVQGIRNGECEAAVVGGCQLNHRFTEWLVYSRGGILSRDGKCKPFDMHADGFGRGEATVSIVLKPLDDALRDRDRIYASILGTSVNSSGSLAPVNAPVASAQYNAMLRAFSVAQRDPKTVDFVELHATGTAIGDPTEANWIGQHFKRDTELLVGSVKGNVGHTEIAAFLVSLCKVCFIIEHRIIPPTVNLSVLNPAIQWKNHRMRAPVVPEGLPIHSPSGRALIALSSSGIGGANGHCVVESHPGNVEEVPNMWFLEPEAIPTLLLAGGLSPRSTNALASALAGIPIEQNIKSLGRLLGRRTRSMLWRSYAIASAGVVSPFVEPILAPKLKPKLVFVFSGQGPQHWDMGRELFRSCKPFQDSVKGLDRLYTHIMGKSLISDIGLFDDSAITNNLGDIWPMTITLPALTILQISLLDTLAMIGVKPDVVVGHSAGETAVLSASGAASKEMALELAIARAQGLTMLEEHSGSMAAVSCSAQRAADIISEVYSSLGSENGALEIGCYNSPDAVTLSGTVSFVALAVLHAKSKGILATVLRTNIAVHSSMVERCQEEYKRRVSGVFAKYTTGSATAEIYSALTGDISTTLFDAQYFWDNTVGPVKFDSAIKAITLRHAQVVFVELGPHPVLSSYIRESSMEGTIALSPMKRSKVRTTSELATFMDFVGRLFSAGYTDVNMDVLYGSTHPTASTLPPYPFAKKAVPYTSPSLEVTRQRQQRRGPLNYPQLRVNTQTHPELADHVIKDEPIMPAAGFMEMALEFGARKLWDVNFHSMLSLSSEHPTPLDVKLEGSRWSVCSSPAAEFDSKWPPCYDRVHATGYLSMDSELEGEACNIPIEDIRSHLLPLDMKAFYSTFESFANYGPLYRRVLSCCHGVNSMGSEELLVEVRGSSDDLNNLKDYVFHPAILDAAIHVVVHPFITGSLAPARYYLPSRVDTVVIHDLLIQGIPEVIYAHVVFAKWAPDALTYDFSITDSKGQMLCTLRGVEVSAHGNTQSSILARYEVSNIELDIHAGSTSERQNMAQLVGDTSTTMPVDSHNSRPLLLHYSRGDEIRLQAKVCALVPSKEETLCLIASEGLDGGAILGFTRSLRKEYSCWKVYAFIFPASRPLSGYDDTALLLCAHRLAEEEMYIGEDGKVTVPRLAPIPTPRRSVTFAPAEPWVYENGTLSQTSRPLVPPDHVLLQLIGISRYSESFYSFIGKLDGSASFFTGISSGPLASHVLAHRGGLMELSGIDVRLGPDVVPALASVLAIGHSMFSNPTRLNNSTMLVTHSDTELGQSICRMYESRGFKIHRLPSNATVAQARAVLARKQAFMISGRQNKSSIEDVDEIIHRLQPNRVFQWDDEATGILRVLHEAPWTIGDALKLVLSGDENFRREYRPPISFLPPNMADHTISLSSSFVFHPRKAYVLLGGIGGLGLRVAYWMYENGAREIILTSRSGASSLTSRNEFIGLRILQYLQSRSDLNLRLEAVDAASTEQTRALFRSIRVPIGGCMIMTGILIDGSYAMQTAESFEGPFVAKAGVFTALQQVLDIGCLDFVLAFSSISGLFGNAGQTNYASANTALSDLGKPYRNVATIVPPFINDISAFITVAATDPLQWSRYKHYSAWAMSCHELCACIGDALMILQERPLWQYVPDFDWSLVRSCLGPSRLYDELVPQVSSPEESVLASEEKRNIGSIVCSTLGIDPQDFDANVPLTSYGLDSLSATALSQALRPYLSISQLQLLADVSLVEIEQRIAAAGGAYSSS